MAAAATSRVCMIASGFFAATTSPPAGCDQRQKATRHYWRLIRCFQAVGYVGQDKKSRWGAGNNQQNNVVNHAAPDRFPFGAGLPQLLPK